MMYYNNVMTQKVFKLVQHDVVKSYDFSFMSILFYSDIILISSISTKIVNCQ